MLDCCSYYGSKRSILVRYLTSRPEAEAVIMYSPLTESGKLLYIWPNCPEPESNPFEQRNPTILVRLSRIPQQAVVSKHAKAVASHQRLNDIVPTFRHPPQMRHSVIVQWLLEILVGEMLLQNPFSSAISVARQSRFLDQVVGLPLRCVPSSKRVLCRMSTCPHTTLDLRHPLSPHFCFVTSHQAR